LLLTVVFEHTPKAAAFFFEAFVGCAGSSANSTQSTSVTAFPAHRTVLRFALPRRICAKVKQVQDLYAGKQFCFVATGGKLFRVGRFCHWPRPRLPSSTTCVEYFFAHSRAKIPLSFYSLAQSRSLMTTRYALDATRACTCLLFGSVAFPSDAVAIALPLPPIFFLGKRGSTFPSVFYGAHK